MTGPAPEIVDGPAGHVKLQFELLHFGRIHSPLPLPVLRVYLMCNLVEVGANFHQMADAVLELRDSPGIHHRSIVHEAQEHPLRAPVAAGLMPVLHPALQLLNFLSVEPELDLKALPRFGSRKREGRILKDIIGAFVLYVLQDSLKHEPCKRTRPLAFLSETIFH